MLRGRLARLSAAIASLVLTAAWAAAAETVDLSKPFEVDQATISLFHLDDVASGEVKDAVEGRKPGKVVEAAEAEGKFGKALSCDGAKSCVDFADAPSADGLTALTVECWVKFRGSASGDLVCHPGQFMIRAGGSVSAYFWIDGNWRIVQGDQPLPVDRWTHVAITWDQAHKQIAVYVDGQLDAAAVPDGITDGKLGGAGQQQMRLGGHTWQGHPLMLNGLLDEVRVSSVVRQYRPAGAPSGSAPAPVAVQGLKPWAKNTDPTDVPKSHTQDLTNGKQTYTVVQGGTMDGRSCRTPMGCGINSEGAFFQSWESNRAVRMENVGETDVLNPWLSNGHNNFRNVPEIANGACAPGMTDAEKAFAAWFQEIRYRHHAGGDNTELGDPVKVFNVYGYNTCGNDSTCMGTLWKALGIRGAPARALGHCISQAFYDNAWHFYDGDMHSVYLLRDNQTVAGEQDIVRDHDLVKRTHSMGILFRDTWWQGQGMPAMYSYEGEVTGDRSGKADTTMDMVLRPGEALVWRWGQLNPVKYHGMLQTEPTYIKVPYIICNGLWEYRPDFTKETWRKGARVEDVVALGQGLTAAEGKAGTIVWTMRSPYVFVGGRLEAEALGAKFSICLDGKTWQGLGGNSLDRFFSTVGPAYYQYQLKCQLAPGAELKRLAIINDVQMAPMALPEMGVGPNEFTYTDQTPGERKVRITHAWVERSAAPAPLAPPAAVYPPDNGESSGTDIVFKWTAPTLAAGDTIVDYQFELSRRADLKLPLSMDFYKLLSRTDDGGAVLDKEGGTVSAAPKPQYTLHHPGLLTPDQKYYWHVRAREAKGLWGPWSQTWSFTARGAAPPVELKVTYDEARGVGTLQWQANPVGRRPAKYRVYGWDEKGFTIGDTDYPCSIGTLTPDVKEQMAGWTGRFPANFITETMGAELPVIGTSVELKTANKAFYRVVAVDEQGQRSGPSDYATAPRPVIYSKPVAAAKLGAEYLYKVAAIRSLGAFVAHEGLGAGYLDIEKPKYTLKGPAWLKLDENKGILSGIPDTAGKAEVEVTATIDRVVRNIDAAKLIWGIEKIGSVTTARVGVATQKFVIDVQP